MKFKLLFKDIVYQSLVSKGIFDKSIFKAILLAGVPGHAKINVDNKVLQKLNLKAVNPDKLLELLSINSNLSIKQPTSVTVDQMNLAHDDNDTISCVVLSKYIDDRLGIMIDGMGRNYDYIKIIFDLLNHLGYDSKIIYINTVIGKALESDSIRDKLAPDDNRSNLEGIQNNIGGFQRLVGSKNFHVIDNNSSESNNQLISKIQKQIRHYASQPIINPIAKQWIDQVMMARKR